MGSLQLGVACLGSLQLGVACLGLAGMPVGDLPMRIVYRVDCAARETCTRARYRSLSGMCRTGEQTDHTGSLCVC